MILLLKKSYRLIKKYIFSLFAFMLAFLAQPSFARDFYWENPLSITNEDSRFPVTVNSGEHGMVFWQTVDTSKKEIYLSCRDYTSLKSFTSNLNFAGPFSYSGDEVPSIYTASALENGLLAVAALSSSGEIKVFTSSDYGKSWKASSIKTSGIMVAPRIFSLGNRFKLFISSGDETSFSIYTSESSDGSSWTSLEAFKPSSNLRNPFLPYLICQGGVETVVFQAQYVNPLTNRISYQLYMTSRPSPMRPWTEAVLITDKSSLSLRDTNDFYAYQNQRPVLFSFEGKIYLAWERSLKKAASIWVASLSANGMEPFSAEAISSGGDASRAIFFEYEDKLWLSWFDTRRGRESAYMAGKDGSFWEEYTLAENENVNQFVSPLVLNDSDSLASKVLTYVWQQTGKNKRNSIVFLAPDRSVGSPLLTPLTFKKGKKSSKVKLSVQVTLPKDSSNIAGYSYVWSRDPLALPPKQIEHFPKETKINLTAGEGDGEYYLTLAAADYAGNWSEPVKLVYNLDTTPPLPPKLNPPKLDKFGFLPSNTFTLDWEEEDDGRSYLYRLDYIGDIPEKLYASPGHSLKLSQQNVNQTLQALEKQYAAQLSKKRSMKGADSTSLLHSKKFQNLSNGVYVLSVSAVDEVGNISQPSQSFVILNKYKPSTVIDYIEQKNSDFGQSEVIIHGRGFTFDGSISKVIIDRDGKEPYDLTLYLKNNQYRVVNDRLLNKIILGRAETELDEGKYKIGLYHTDRGLYFSSPILTIQQNGTIKIEGQYTRPQRFFRFTDSKYTLTIYFILSALLLIFIVLVAMTAFGKITLSVYEEAETNILVKKLLYGGKLRMKLLSKIISFKPSLRKKLVGFTFSLIIIVVMGVSLTNGQRVISLQEKTLSEGLENRTSVLLESLGTGVKNFFPSNNLLELSALPRQKDAMSEVEYVTIIGQPMNSTSSENLRYVWATNDPEILSKIDTAELIYGQSQITDEGYLQILEELSPVDSWVSQNEQVLSDKIEALTRQAEQLYASASDDAYSQAEFTSETLVTLRNQLDADLLGIAQNATDSYPHFDSSNLDYKNTDYIFYRPVLYRRGTSNNYVHAVVLMKLSTQSLVDSVIAETSRILIFGSVISVMALIIGIIGASIFAMVIVHPIKRLESHVEMIGRTKNKLNLKGKDIKIRSKDEIGRLGLAVNNMTHELVSVAEEESLTMDGKAVQNAFLPLTSDEHNNKKTTAQFKDDRVECFGYYEGESGVSGDYFDFRRLDKDWFVAIKCDASGHGIPAAIIMTVVATIFRRYFDHWTYKHDGSNINRVVDQINDFIEKLGLKGKFATLIICLINLKTGELYTCNAGDSIIHIFEAATKKLKTVNLKSAPTAGVFPNDLLQMRGGFAVEKLTLNRGDILYLYTDGIEESTRRVRDDSFAVKSAEVNGKIDDEKEEFGAERIINIIEAVLNGQAFELTKRDNPRIDEHLIFNFEDCSGKIEDSIIALAALEKVFRMYKSHQVAANDYIKVDRRIDEFLREHFSLYGFYAANREDLQPESNYVDYNIVQEDEQSDDLTLLAIKRL